MNDAQTKTQMSPAEKLLVQAWSENCGCRVLGDRGQLDLEWTVDMYLAAGARRVGLPI